MAPNSTQFWGRVMFLFQKTTLLNIRFFRFLLVGIINTFFGYILYITCLWLGFHYGAALAIATILGVLFNFKSTGTLVFHSHDNTLLWRFICVYAAIYGINVLSVGALFRFGLAHWLGGLVMLLPLALISYFLNSRLVFNS